MSEDQIVDRVSMIDQWKVSGDSYTQGELDAIGQLLELYYGIKKELEQEKEKNKEYEKQLDLDYVDKNYIHKDKIKEKMEQTKKVYDEEMKPYMLDTGNGEKVLNVTGLNKKEKEELINKRNCLLVQIKTYEMLLEEK